MASFLDAYRKVTGFPGGKYLFNKLIGYKAPFFGTIHPNILELESALSVVEMKDRRSIRNHIGSVNAGAMCTLAELSGGLALDAAIPRDLHLPGGSGSFCACRNPVNRVRWGPAIDQMRGLVTTDE